MKLSDADRYKLGTEVMNLIRERVNASLARGLSTGQLKTPITVIFSPETCSDVHKIIHRHLHKK